MSDAAVLSPRAPQATDDLADLAVACYRAGGTSASVRADELATLVREPLGDGLTAWAEEIATGSGFPLFGTGLASSTYAALLWNGARLEAVRPDADWAPLLAALASAGPEVGLERVGRALAAADRVRRAGAALIEGSRPLAVPTLTTLAAATAAALLAPDEGEGLARVLDLAASLMVLTPGAPPRGRSPLWAGHGAASGWLAARLPDEAAMPMRGSVVHTLSVAAGRELPDRNEPETVAALLGVLR